LNLDTKNIFQGHEKSQKQRLKERFKSNFQKMNKTKLCDLKIKTQELRTKTRNVQNDVKTNFYYVNLCKYEHDKVMVKIMFKTSVNRLKEMKGPTSIYIFSRT
jgi:hypothetical protein